MIIRSSQFQALAEAREHLFDKKVAEDLPARYPELCGNLEPHLIRELVDAAIGRGRGYGLSGEAELHQFTELAFRFGREFDTDPDLPWAAMIEYQREAWQREPSIEQFRKLAANGLRPRGPRYAWKG